MLFFYTQAFTDTTLDEIEGLLFEILKNLEKNTAEYNFLFHMIDNIKLSHIIRPLKDRPNAINNVIRNLKFIENKDEVFEFTLS